MRYDPIGLWMVFIVLGLALILGSSSFAVVSRDAFTLTDEEAKLIEARLKFVGLLVMAFSTLGIAMLLIL